MQDKKQLSRRDFLHNSVELTRGLVFFPSLATLMLNARMGLANGGDAFPAFIGIDLAGGASIAGNNVMVYDRGGDPLPNYRGLGLPDALNPASADTLVDMSLGLPMHVYSGMLRGITAVLSEGVGDRVNGFVICAQSADDTADNELATAPGILLGGSQGTVIPLVGTETAGPGDSGGRSRTPFAAGVAPIQITGIDSAKEILSVGKVWQYSPQKAYRVLQSIEKLSAAQFARFSELGLSTQIGEIMQGGYLNAKSLLYEKNNQGKVQLKPNIFDPANDLTSEFIAAHTNKAALEIGYLVLKGYAGAGTITIPGYDYHDGTATTGEQKDEEAGRVIGMLIEMAALLGRKLMLHIYTDGGVAPDTGKAEAVPGSEQGKFVWQGDSETRAAAFVLVYDPAGRPVLRSDLPQMGAYKAGGTVDLNPGKHAKICTSPRAHAGVVVANWLAWWGREADFAQVMPGAPVMDAELDDYLFLQDS